MGAATSEAEPPPEPLQGAESSWVRSWKNLLAGIGGTVARLERSWATRRRLRPPPPHPGEKLPRPGEKAVPEWPLPQFVSLFLPEFPIRPPAGQQQLKILGLVAKGSFGTVLKVLDCRREKVFAVKVVPKVEVLRRDTLKQCKEEVSIQRQISHPFVHCLGDSWQGQRHLFIMCTYCGTGDLYALWASLGHLEETTIRLFAAELALALGYLHDLGIVHRDVKMENILLDERGHLKLTDFGLSRQLGRGQRARTICGTLQYMAPEVLSGGPYSHAADWWSLGVLLFTLAAGQLLCRNPLRRLHHLHHVESHLFFRGVSFDAELLQKQPVELVVAARRAEEAALGPSPAFADFDCDLLPSPSHPCPG
ncbi:ribosomal protein S6 kinase-related protein isoform X2 [Carettochelys insculpta]|uniref:ribosomal protein S6 kinase-related protein isoform X2 n=1 Tax=Carettochelys insculpta TaxID=44489 RepID=UPI003EBC169A